MSWSQRRAREKIERAHVCAFVWDGVAPACFHAACCHTGLRQQPPLPSMLELWRGDRRILRVTLRMLLGMRGGTGDYDDRGLSLPAFQLACAY